MPVIERGHLSGVPTPELRLRPRHLFVRAYSTWAEGYPNATVSAFQTTGAAADTKGSWVQPVASTENDIYELELSLSTANMQSSVNTSTIIDISIGGSGSEAAGIIVSNLQFGHMFKGESVRLPVFIPKGSPLSFRHADAVGGRIVSYHYPRARNGGRVVKPAPYMLTYGEVTASSRGTNMTVPGSDNTKGAWTELTSATAERIMGVFVCVGSGSSNMQNHSMLVDIGAGPSGSERVIIPNVHNEYDLSENLYKYGYPRMFEVDIPAGTRLAARYQRSNTNVNNHNCHLVCAPWRR